MHFDTDAKKVRTSLTRAVPSVDVRKGTHLTLKITIVSRGKTHTISLPVNPLTRSPDRPGSRVA